MSRRNKYAATFGLGPDRWLLVCQDLFHPGREIWINPAALMRREKRRLSRGA